MIGAVKSKNTKWLVMSGNKWYTGTDFSSDLKDAMVYSDSKNATYAAERSRGVVYNMSGSKYSKLVKEAKKAIKGIGAAKKVENKKDDLIERLQRSYEQSQRDARMKQQSKARSNQLKELFKKK
jgi:TATA-box binding protein (TBP) (component of TFIID and TFIIIB)